MSISHAPLDSRIFATQPVAMRALAVELRRNPRASAATCSPLASTRLGAHSLVPGKRRQDGALHLDIAAGTTSVEASNCPTTITK
ncbi:hypothetical protein [Paeniglutamicibacter sp.]|uniref:hypothetical protein n=1 Tax=Paeniglutamicibacter sp. TaxID=1934391 RepID=UPI0039896067